MSVFNMLKLKCGSTRILLKNPLLPSKSDFLFVTFFVRYPAFFQSQIYSTTYRR